MTTIKNVLLISLVAITLWRPAYSSNLEPLTKYFAKNDLGDSAVVAYMGMRCASLVAYTTSIMPSSTPQNKIEELEGIFDDFHRLSIGAIMESSKLEVSDAAERFQKTMKGMLDLQVASSNENYISTGSYLTGSDFGDFELCMGMAEALQ